jgi:hypothetical protein
MHTVQEWIAGFALDAVRLQRIFSQAFEDQADARLSCNLLFVRETEVSLPFTAAARRTAGFELRAVPLNLNYAIRFRTRADKHHRVRLTVVQCPVDTGKPLP